MGGEFYGFEINYYSIGGYGDSSYNSYDYKDRKYCDFEKKGYRGFTVSDMSDWELREIRRWVKKETAYVYLSTVEEYHTTDNGGYRDNCVCLWFSAPKRIDKFVAFLKTLPSRSFMVDIKVDGRHPTETKELCQLFQKDIMKSNRRIVCRDDGYVTLCFDDDVEAMAFKLRWI